MTRARNTRFNQGLASAAVLQRPAANRADHRRVPRGLGLVMAREFGRRRSPRSCRKWP